MADYTYQKFIENLSDFMRNINERTSSENSRSNWFIDLNCPISSLNTCSIHQSKIFNTPSIPLSTLPITKTKSSPRQKTLVASSFVKKEPRFHIDTQWSDHHDRFLIKIVYLYSSNWKKVQNRIISCFKIKKDIPFLKERYYNSKQKIEERKGRFSDLEDRQLLELIGKYGKNWIKISSCYEGRNPIMVKNRYYYLLKTQNN
jgi:Myb-like DNA-binding domain